MRYLMPARYRLACLQLLAVLILAVPTAAQCRYELTVLTSEDDCVLQGLGLSDTGFVAGVMSCPPFGRDAFFWPGEGEPILLPMPSGDLAIANDVNAKGNVVGCYSSGVGDRAFLWDGTETTNLGVLPDHNWSEALAINADGIVVGFSQNLQTGPKLPVIWLKHEIVELSTFFESIYRGSAYDVNDRGLVVGRYRPLQESRHGAFSLDLETGERVDIGAVPGSDEGEAHAVNNLGQVVVQGDDLKNNDTRTFLWESGEMTDLGLLPGHTELRGNDMNDRGLIVGTGEGENIVRGFVWQNGQLCDINELIDTDGFTVRGLHAINNAGQMVGKARRTHNDQVVGVLLTPIGASPGDATGDCRVDFEDLLAVLREWGPCSYCVADLDGNGIVDLDDLLIVLASWS